MLLLSEAILRIRNKCPVFQGRCQGTQSFYAATNEDADIDLPHCFVVPISDSAEDDGLPSQRVTEQFATIVCADNSVDPRKGRGYVADTLMRQARLQLVNALMDWTPFSMMNLEDIKYVGGRHLSMNNAKIWQQYTWKTAYRMSATGNDDDPTYLYIEAIISGYMPNVDASKIRKIMTNGVPTDIPINPEDESTFETVYEAINGQLPEWIKHHYVRPGCGNTADPSDVLFSGDHRAVGDP